MDDSSVLLDAVSHAPIAVAFIAYAWLTSLLVSRILRRVLREHRRSTKSLEKVIKKLLNKK